MSLGECYEAIAKPGGTNRLPHNKALQVTP
jgi:hypothetical protein